LRQWTTPIRVAFENKSASVVYITTDLFVPLFSYSSILEVVSLILITQKEGTLDQNPNKMSSSNAQSPPTLSQVVALTYTYQRVVVVWGAFPALTALLPFVTGSSLFVLNLLTDGHGMLSLVLTILFTLGGYNVIHRLASKKSLQASLDKNEVRLPVAMFISSCILARFVLGPLVAWLGLTVSIPTKIISFSGAFRFAFGMALLGLAVVARYVGPASISKYERNTSILRGDSYIWCAFSPSILCIVFYSAVLGGSVGVEPSRNVFPAHAKAPPFDPRA
jgi:TRAP-type C4-dicarboxylate transport system permease small subunit